MTGVSLVVSPDKPAMGNSDRAGIAWDHGGAVVVIDDEFVLLSEHGPTGNAYDPLRTIRGGAVRGRVGHHRLALVWGPVVAAAVLASLVVGAGPGGAQVEPRAVGELTVAPDRNLADGDTVAVTGRATGGDWEVAQCSRTVVDDPGPERRPELCAPAAAAEVGADGVLSTTLVVGDPLITSSGTPMDCRATGCVMLVTTPAEATAWAWRALNFGPPTVTVPATPVTETGVLTVTATGLPGTSTAFSICATPVPDDPAASTCAPIGSGETTFALGGWGDYSIGLPLQFVPLAFGPVDCRTVSCVVAAVSPVDGVVTATSAPIRLAQHIEIALEPATGLLDGQVATITAANLAPGVTYAIRQCEDGRCSRALTTVDADAAGTITTTVPVSQHFESVSAPGLPGRYCRAQCHIAVSTPYDEALSLLPYFARTPVTLAEGTIALSPASGLADGDVVTLTGTDLMPNYVGRSLGPWATGSWATAQCDAAVVDDLSLYGVFTHCSLGPSLTTPAVTSPALTADIPVEATITRILGGTVDCTAAPGTCVVGLVRLEQDASISHHLAPVAFGPG